MERKCPKCGGKLGIFDLKPNCPHCGCSIMYYDMDKRLEEDSVKAELRRNVGGEFLHIADI